jgi:hypothetical protein
MIDYLDEDVAYLLGLIIGRGEFLKKDNETIITIHFPFKQERLEGYVQFSEIIKSIHTNIYKRINNLLETPINIEPLEKESSVYLKIRFFGNPLSLRNIRLLLKNRLVYSQFLIPEEIYFQDNLNIIKEFIKGFADASGNIRRSNRDQIGRHRVYLDILNINWYLPVQLCFLLQNKLKIPVSNILWGHPNLRDPKSKGGKEAWSREHQIRIYAEAFREIGFSIDYKNKLLQELADENIQKFGNLNLSFCNPLKKRKGEGKSKIHKGEKSNDLPSEIRGKHFNSYWEICAHFGCQEAQEKLKNLERQKKIF